MHIDMQSQDFALTDALRGHAERRLAFSLGRSADQVGRVAVVLADINGPRGGIDKRCRIRVKLSPALEVVVEDTQPDMYAAIDRAAERIGRAVARNLRRKRHARFVPRTLRDMVLPTSS